MPQECREWPLFGGRDSSIDERCLIVGHDILAFSAPVHRFAACCACADPKPRKLDVSFGVEAPPPLLYLILLLG